MDNFPPLLKQPKKFRLLHSNENPVFANFYRPVTHVIPFAAAVPAVLQIELVSVNGTDHLSKSVDEAIGKNTASVRAFVGECKQLFLVPADTDLLTLDIQYGNVIGCE